MARVLTPLWAHISSACCWQESSLPTRQWGVPAHTRISLVVWLLAQEASDLCVRASIPILHFFILGGVALHERLVGRGGQDHNRPKLQSIVP
jgi:hypothetical protein